MDCIFIGGAFHGEHRDERNPQKIKSVAVYHEDGLTKDWYELTVVDDGQKGLYCWFHRGMDRDGVYTFSQWKAKKHGDIVIPDIDPDRIQQNYRNAVRPGQRTQQPMRRNNPAPHLRMPEPNGGRRLNYQELHDLTRADIPELPPPARRQAQLDAQQFVQGGQWDHYVHYQRVGNNTETTANNVVFEMVEDENVTD